MILTVRTRAWAGLGIAAAVGALALAPPAGAQTGGGTGGDASVQALRAEADAASGAYFGALSRYATLQGEIAGVEAQLPTLRAEEAAAVRAATGRAVAAYESAGSQELGAIITSESVLAAARQTQWLRVLNAREDRVLLALRRADDRLRARERTLRAEQQNAAGALTTLQAQGQVLEARLGAAQARQSQLVAAAASTGPSAPAGSTAPPAAGPTGPPTGGTPAPAPAAPPAPSPGYTPTPGANPHHDDPFLTCIRARESGGNYRAYNPAGPYMGAYQFLQATWDGAANHIGRTALIGVRPDQASPFDQDDVAWGAYQWQGAGPWGGHCP
ncbi:MAG TPA: transglycosylase family protein [Acidimicrobiia bacterium]|nr:transglycosylase family protein [Acidimicrobiia bacterium]